MDRTIVLSPSESTVLGVQEWVNVVFRQESTHPRTYVSNRWFLLVVRQDQRALLLAAAVVAAAPVTS